MINMVNERPIYMILCFQYANKELTNEKGIHTGWPDMGHEDFVGFYYEKETAIQALHENWANIQDHYNYAAFLLTQSPGLYKSVTKENRIYFVWDTKRKGFFEQEEPKIFEHVSF